MTPLTRAKLAAGAVGLGIWAYGVRADDEVVRWVGMALIAAASLLRFLNPRQPQ